MKERLDQILWKYGYVDSIDKAKRLIMLGAVIVNEQKIEKPGSLIQYSEDMKIRIKGQENPYVSRGGFKLKRRLTVLLVLSKEKEFLILELLQGALRTVPYRKELPMCMLWMWEPINWPGN